MLYNGILIFFALLRFSLLKSLKDRDIAYWFLLFGLLLFSAFRFEVGCDWNNYAIKYSHFAQIYGTVDSILTSMFSTKEPGWWFLLYAMQELGLEYVWLNAITSIIFFLGVDALARRQPDKFSFLLLLFPILIINMPMSGIAQAAAIGVMCFAFLAFINRSVVKYLAWVILASSLHSSAFIFILLVPLVSGDYNFRRIILSGFLALPGLAILATSSTAELAYSRYVGTTMEAAGGIFRISLLVLTALLFQYKLKDYWKLHYVKDYKLIQVGILMIFSLLLIAPVSTVIADRMGYYFILIQTIVLARIPYLDLGKQNKKLVYLPYLVLILVLLVWTSISSHFKWCYVPYETWLFGL